MVNRRLISIAPVAIASLALAVGCSSQGAPTPSEGGAPDADSAGAPSDSGASDAGIPIGDATGEGAPGDAAPDSDPEDAVESGEEPANDADGAGPDALADGDATMPRDGGADATPDAGADAGAPPRYTNPVLAQDFPDPFVLRQGGIYYAFATNAAGKNIQAATSTDLAHWSVLGDALPVLPAWAAKNAGLTWAPAVLPRPAGFVMYYTARDTASGFQCISFALASNPAGPYVDASTSPFVCQVTGAQNLCGSIDPSAFVDADGTAYLLWKSDENASRCASPPRLWTAPLSDQGTTLTAGATPLLVMDQPWQSPIIEAPAMTLVDGTYYLLYSANAYESAAYAMGYATCLSAKGPCLNRSVSGPAIASAGSALGPGGGAFFDDTAGGRWLAYHAWTAPKTTYAGGGARSLRIDRLVIGGGALSLVGPTTTPQLL